VGEMSTGVGKPLDGESLNISLGAI